RIVAASAAEVNGTLRVRAVVDGALGGSDGAGIVARRGRGELTLAEFERALAAALSEGLERPIDPMGLHGRLFAAERVDEEMVEAVARLRAAGVPTAMLSNTWGEGDDQDALADRFDVVLLSGRIGMRKPEPAIFVAA